MSVLMICGSPHDKGGNSTYLLERLKEKLGGGEICNALKSPQISENMFADAVARGENIVFSFPLYADSLPAYFLGFLKRLEQPTKEITSDSRVYVIVNNGFYDDFQNRIAIEIMWKWCEKCGLKKGRALAVGAGGMVHAAPFGKGPMAKVAAEIKALADDIQNSRSGDTVFIHPSFPRFMYTIAGNMSFVAEGRKNGLSKSDMKVCRSE